MTQKMLFTDLDDTLLNRKKEVTKKTRAAIDAALAAGHRIVLNTGRPLPAAMPLIRKLGFDGPGFYASCYNGGLVWDCGEKKAIFQKAIPLVQLQEIFDFAKEMEVYCQTYDDDMLLVPAYTEEADFYINLTHIPWREEPGLPGSAVVPPEKCLLIDLHDYDRLVRIREEFLRRFSDKGLNCFFSSPYLLEVLPTGVTKGDALRYLCGLTGIPVEHSVSAGDQENDISMIEAAGVGCAMANAVPACKEAADYITEADCDHDGLAEIIEKFILA